MNIAVKVILGIALALSLAGTAWGANWNSPPEPNARPMVNWSS